MSLRLIIPLTRISLWIASALFTASEYSLSTNFILLFCLVECPIGKYYDASDRKCKLCSNGTYQDVEGQFGCKKCQPGFHTLGNDEKNFTSCKGNKMCWILEELQWKLNISIYLVCHFSFNNWRSRSSKIITEPTIQIKQHRTERTRKEQKRTEQDWTCRTETGQNGTEE